MWARPAVQLVLWRSSTSSVSMPLSARLSEVKTPLQISLQLPIQRSLRLRYSLLLQVSLDNVLRCEINVWTRSLELHAWLLVLWVRLVPSFHKAPMSAFNWMCRLNTFVMWELTILGVSRACWGSLVLCPTSVTRLMKKKNIHTYTSKLTSPSQP